LRRRAAGAANAIRGELLRLGLEHVDEQPADRLALDLGVGDTGERRKEQRLRLDVISGMVVVAEQRHHLLAFAGKLEAEV
jgi:hypothetical protein